MGAGDGVSPAQAPRHRADTHRYFVMSCARSVGRSTPRSRARVSSSSRRASMKPAGRMSRTRSRPIDRSRRPGRMRGTLHLLTPEDLARDRGRLGPGAMARGAVAEGLRSHVRAGRGMIAAVGDTLSDEPMLRAVPGRRGRCAPGGPGARHETAHRLGRVSWARSPERGLLCFGPLRAERDDRDASERLAGPPDPREELGRGRRDCERGRHPSNRSWPSASLSPELPGGIPGLRSATPPSAGGARCAPPQSTTRGRPGRTDVVDIDVDRHEVSAARLLSSPSTDDKAAGRRRPSRSRASAPARLRCRAIKRTPPADHGCQWIHPSRPDLRVAGSW